MITYGFFVALKTIGEVILLTFASPEEACLAMAKREKPVIVYRLAISNTGLVSLTPGKCSVERATWTMAK